MIQVYSNACGCSCCDGKRQLVDRLAEKIGAVIREALKCTNHIPVQNRDGEEA